jgi:hypothetical protein
MRTTLDLDPIVLAELKARQRREGGTLGALASRLLAGALGAGESPSTTPALAWPGADLGLLVDIEDADALERAMAEDR